MKRLQVLRTHISPYQSKDFLSLEDEMVSRFHELSYESRMDQLVDETILITNTHTDLKLIPSSVLKKTRLIIHPNSGYDNFAADFEIWKDIPVVIGHTIRAQAVAEYSIGALFEGLLNLPQHISWHQERTWDRTLLKDTSVWIFGYGHIGKIISDTLVTLGMKVTVIDPFETNCPHPRLNKWQEGKFRDVKVAIAALGLNSTSMHIFNEEFFSAARPDLLFINGARGKLVSEKALKEFLLTHPDAFAFLDVFEKEPFGEEWHGFPQVWKTSHIAGVEKSLDNKILQFEEAILRDYLGMNSLEFKSKYEKELLQNKIQAGVLI